MIKNLKRINEKYQICTTDWQNGLPGDKMAWIKPVIKMEPDSQEYFNGEDKAKRYDLNYNLKSIN